MPDERTPLIEDLEQVHDGDPWYGSSRVKVLSDVTAKEAATRPAPNSHTIWELLLHMEAWTREVTRRLRGARAAEPEMGDWPAVSDTTDNAWKRALGALDAAHQELIAALKEFPESRLGERVGDDRDPPLGSGVSYAATLRGLAQHDAYHIGQVAALKKVLRG